MKRIKNQLKTELSNAIMQDKIKQLFKSFKNKLQKCYK